MVVERDQLRSRLYAALCDAGRANPLLRAPSLFSSLAVSRFLASRQRIDRFLDTTGHFLFRYARDLIEAHAMIEPDFADSIELSNQNCGTEARAFWSLLIFNCSSYWRAADSSSRTIKLLRSQRIAPSVRCHILSPIAPAK